MYTSLVKTNISDNYQLPAALYTKKRTKLK